MVAVALLVTVIVVRCAAPKTTQPTDVLFSRRKPQTSRATNRRQTVNELRSYSQHMNPVNGYHYQEL